MGFSKSGVQGMAPRGRTCWGITARFTESFRGINGQHYIFPYLLTYNAPLGVEHGGEDGGNFAFFGLPRKNDRVQLVHCFLKLKIFSSLEIIMGTKYSNFVASWNVQYGDGRPSKTCCMLAWGE
jgi:hypothetical protein